MTFVTNLSLNIKHLFYVTTQSIGYILNALDTQQRTTTIQGAAHFIALLTTENKQTQHPTKLSQNPVTMCKWHLQPNR